MSLISIFVGVRIEEGFVRVRRVVMCMACLLGIAESKGSFVALRLSEFVLEDGSRS